MLIPLALISLALFPLGSRCAQGDGVQIIGREGEGSTSAQLPTDERSTTIRSYFEDQGLRVILEEKDYDQYSDEVVNKMAEWLKEKPDFVKAYHLNRQINSMIHGSIATKESSAYEAIMKALNLIIPRTESQPIFELAKEDLRQFYGEQPVLGKELLDRVGWKLKIDELHTQDAIKFLEGSFHNWIPLGRLAKFIEDYGEAENSLQFRLG